MVAMPRLSPARSYRMSWGAQRRLSRHEHNGKAPIREDGQDLIEVHVAGVVVRPVKGRWKVLAAKRTDKRSLFPEKWECGGGQVRSGEDFKTAIRRQMFEEFGLKVEPCYIVEDYSIHVPEERQRTIPGVRYVCTASEGRVRLNKREFTQYRWVDFPVPKLDWIPGVKEMLDSLQLPPPEPAPADAVSYQQIAEPKPPASTRRLPPGFASTLKKVG